MIRHYGSIDWKKVEETFSLEEAKERGDNHVNQYAHDLANHMIQNAEQQGLDMFSDQKEIDEDQGWEMDC